jgi:hypothetical protein
MTRARISRRTWMRAVAMAAVAMDSAYQGRISIASSKTDTHRQAELTRLIASLVQVRASP